MPLGQIQPGDKILVMTDDAMDPLVWQAFMAVSVFGKHSRRVVVDDDVELGDKVKSYNMGGQRNVVD